MKISVEIIENRNTSWQVGKKQKPVENGPLFEKQKSTQGSSVWDKI